MVMMLRSPAKLDSSISGDEESSSCGFYCGDTPAARPCYPDKGSGDTVKSVDKNGNHLICDCGTNNDSSPSTCRGSSSSFPRVEDGLSPTQEKGEAGTPIRRSNRKRKLTGDLDYETITGKQRSKAKKKLILDFDCDSDELLQSVQFQKDLKDIKDDAVATTTVMVKPKKKKHKKRSRKSKQKDICENLDVIKGSSPLSPRDISKPARKHSRRDRQKNSTALSVSAAATEIQNTSVKKKSKSKSRKKSKSNKKSQAKLQSPTSGKENTKNNSTSKRSKSSKSKFNSARRKRCKEQREAFFALRDCLPDTPSKLRTQVEILKKAASYIQELSEQVNQMTSSKVSCDVDVIVKIEAKEEVKEVIPAQDDISSPMENPSPGSPDDVSEETCTDAGLVDDSGVSDKCGENKHRNSLPPISVFLRPVLHHQDDRLDATELAPNTETLGAEFDRLLRCSVTVLNI